MSLTLATLLAGCGEIAPNDPGAERRSAAVKLAEVRRLKRACGSQQTFERLKVLTFEEAVRVRRVASPELHRLAGVSVARMEDPVATTRDERLGLIVCSGRLIVELPPGAQDVFDGDRRLEARVEYAAQQAAHGEGLVYRMQGAEPIVYRLAAYDLPMRVAGRSKVEPIVLASADAQPDAIPTKADPPLTVEPKPVPGPVRPAAKLAARDTAPSKLAPVAVKRAHRPEPPVRVAEVRRERSATSKATARPVSPKSIARKAEPAKPIKAKSVLQAQTRRERARPVVRLASTRTAPAASKRPVRSATRAAVRVKPPVKVAKASPERRASASFRTTAAKPERRAARPESKAKPPLRVATVRKSTLPVRVAEVRPVRSRPAERAGDECAYIRGSVDRLICSDPRLSRAERRMGATFYAALADADPETRAELRRSRARFLAYRDRCPSAGCVAQAYADRIEEIRDIASGNY